MKISLSLVTLALISTSQAIVLLNDTFSDNDRTNANLPDSGKWFVGGANSPSSSVSNGGLVTTSGSTLMLTTAFTGPSGYTLADGETIRLTFNVTTSFGTNPSNAVANSFRFGIFDSKGSQINADTTGGNGSTSLANAWDGYSIWTPYASPSSATSVVLYERTGEDSILYTSTAGVNTSIGSVPYTNGNLVNSTTYTGSFAITRVGDTLSIVSSLGDTSLSATDQTPSTFTFDSITFFAGGTALGSNGSFTLDNVTVEVIPEPSSLLIAALMPIAFLRRRR